MGRDERIPAISELAAAAAAAILSYDLFQYNGSS